MGPKTFLAENETQGLTLIKHVLWGANFWLRLRGLTFRRQLAEDEALLLVCRRESRADAAIHMFFVFFPIGVLWLDAQDCVVDKVVARPFRPIYVPRSPAKSVLECQPGVVDRVEIGDRLRLVPREEANEV